MFYSTRRLILSPTFRFVFVFFRPFSTAITSLGEERAGVCAFRAFICFPRIGFCLFSLPLGIREWLRLVIMAFPWLFCLPFYFKQVTQLLKCSRYSTIIQPLCLPKFLLEINVSPYCLWEPFFFIIVLSMIRSTVKVYKYVGDKLFPF